MLSLLRIESLPSPWLAFVCNGQRARQRARHLQRGNLGCSQAGMSVDSDNSELHISNRPSANEGSTQPFIRNTSETEQTVYNALQHSCKSEALSSRCRLCFHHFTTVTYSGKPQPGVSDSKYTRSSVRSLEQRVESHRRPRTASDGVRTGKGVAQASESA